MYLEWSGNMVVALRVGLLVPANNTTMERELPAWMPTGTRCTTLKIPRPPGLLTKADLPAYIDCALKLAETVRGEVDVVVYGCTAAGFLAGPVRDAEIAASLADIVGRPTVTTAGSMNPALAARSARRIALVTPYSPAVNESLRGFLAEAGVEVEILSSFGAADVEALGKITAAQVEERARDVMTDACDAMFIACSQLPTHGVVERLEQSFGRPVTSSIKATAWRATKALEAASH